MMTIDGPHVMSAYVAKLAYRAELDADDRGAIQALPFTVQALERYETFVHERDAPTQSCLMLSGMSFRSKLVAQGARAIVGIHFRGEMVDLQNSLLKVADHSVGMLTSGKVAKIPREAVLELCAQRLRVAHAMWLDTLVDGSIFREWITSNSRRDARSRIAHLLCEFALRMKVAGLGDEHHYELPMTQEQVADATGLTSVHVNRTLKALSSDGLIKRLHPRSIFVADLRRLAEVGDFDPTYLHLAKADCASF